MPLAIGQRLGSYEILASIGAGGMDEVYRAKDMKLGRDVALKILPAVFATDADRLARFEREARVLASLDHPNIGHIYGLQESDGTRALVLALIEGPTLADRIARGPLQQDEARTIALQIAEAFEYAHDRGVIHRDLKPANIKITPDGVVKVLDFGLAKALEGEEQGTSPGAHSPTMLPTMSMGATQPGVILGTAAYISPEQVKGKQADRRSDIWAFGIVLYELLTGERPFQGDSIGELMAEIVKQEPKLDAVPLWFRALVARCLTKEPRKRLQSFGEARLMLEEPVQPSPLPAPQSEFPASSWRGRLVWIVAAALFGAAAVALAVMHLRESKQELFPMTLSIIPPEGAVLKMNSTISLSPDGRHLAFVAGRNGKDELWVRDMDSSIPRVLPNTDAANDPFWSPDSSAIAFFAEGKLKKVNATGGAALTICEASNDDRGGTWNDNGTIVFAPSSSGALYQVQMEGGNPIPAATPDPQANERSYRFPFFLPDQKRFIYSVLGKREVNIADLNARAKHNVFMADSNVRFVPPGYLLFVKDGALIAQQVSPNSLTAIGGSIPIADQVSYDGGNGRGQFTTSETGALA